MKDVTEFLARADACRRAYDLHGAASAYAGAWDHLPRFSGLRAAQIRKWEGNIALWQGDFGKAEQSYQDALGLLAGLDPSGTEAHVEEIRCLADLGQLDQQRGRRTSALDLLTRALDLGPHNDDADRIRLVMAEILASRSGGTVEAGSIIEHVKCRRREWGAVGLEARLEQAQGLLAASLDDYVAARVHFDRAVELSVQSGDTLLRVRNTHNQAALLLSRGAPGQAQQLLADVVEFYDSRGFTGLALAAWTDLGIVELALGALDQATSIFMRVDSEYEAAIECDPRARARSLDGWANVHQARGELEEAASKHARALGWLEVAEAREAADRGRPDGSWNLRDRATLLEHLATDHLLTHRLRYVQRARDLLLESARLLADQPGAETQAAHCQANLGVAHAQLGELPKAKECFTQACKHFRTTGRLLEQVAASHNLGCTIALMSQDDPVGLNDALGLLIPAALVRDSVRFTLSLSDQRKQWWQREAAASLAESLRIAARVGDPHLVTELILVFRLPGSLEVVKSEDHPSVWFTALPSQPVALETNAALRLVHGPRLGLPGRIALEAYLDQAREQYGRDVRTLSVATIAGQPAWRG